jgi:hypothetical protein
MSWLDVLKVDAPASGSFRLPRTNAEWLNILENPIETKNFEMQVGIAIKNKTPLRYIESAKAFLTENRSANVVARILLRDEPRNTKAEIDAKREKVNQIKENYNSIKDILDTIKDYDRYESRQVSGAAKQSSTRRKQLVREFLEYIALLKRDGLAEDDWEHLEELLREHFSSIKNYTQKAERFLAGLTDINVIPLTEALPENEEKFEWLHTIFAKDETELEDKFQGAFDAEYSVNTITVPLAKKYIQSYTEWKSTYAGGRVASKQKGEAKYSMAMMRLTGSRGRDLLKHLQNSTSGASKNWTSKLILELLGEAENLDGFSQWTNWKRAIESKFKIREEAVKDMYLEESWQKKNSSEQSPYAPSTTTDIEVLETDVDTEQEYKDLLDRQSSRSPKNFNTYLAEKTQNIEALNSAVPPEFFKFIQEVNAELVEGTSSRRVNVFKEIFGDEKTEEYIESLSNLKSPDMGGFSQSGSARVGIGRERTPLYQLPSKDNNLVSDVISEIHENLVGEVKSAGAWSKLNRAYLKYKNTNPEFVRSRTLQNLGTNTSQFKDITAELNEIESVIAEFIYNLYVSKVDFEDLFKQGATSRPVGTDYDLLEFIRVLRVADSIFGGGKITQELSSLYPNTKNDKDVIDRTKEVMETTPLLFYEEIKGLTQALTGSLKVIREGIAKAVEKKLVALIANKSRLKSQIPWMLNNLVKEGFITKVS